MSRRSSVKWILPDTCGTIENTNLGVTSLRARKVSRSLQGRRPEEPTDRARLNRM